MGVSRNWNLNKLNCVTMIASRWKRAYYASYSKQDSILLFVIEIMSRFVLGNKVLLDRMWSEDSP